MLNNLVPRLIEDQLSPDAPQKLNLSLTSISKTNSIDTVSPEPGVKPALQQDESLQQQPAEKHTKRTKETKRVNLTTHLNACQKITCIGSWEKDLTSDDQSNLYWSDEIFRILGYEPGKTTPHFGCFVNAIHPDDRMSVVARLKNLTKIGHPFETEHRLLTLIQLRFLLMRKPKRPSN